MVELLAYITILEPSREAIELDRKLRATLYQFQLCCHCNDYLALYPRLYGTVGMLHKSMRQKAHFHCPESVYRGRWVRESSSELEVYPTLISVSNP